MRLLDLFCGAIQSGPYRRHVKPHDLSGRDRWDRVSKMRRADTSEGCDELRFSHGQAYAPTPRPCSRRTTRSTGEGRETFSASGSSRYPGRAFCCIRIACRDSVCEIPSGSVYNRSSGTTRSNIADCLSFCCLDETPGRTNDKAVLVFSTHRLSSFGISYAVCVEPRGRGNHHSSIFDGDALPGNCSHKPHKSVHKPCRDYTIVTYFVQ